MLTQQPEGTSQQHKRRGVSTRDKRGMPILAYCTTHAWHASVHTHSLLTICLGLRLKGKIIMDEHVWQTYVRLQPNQGTQQR